MTYSNWFYYILRYGIEWLNPIVYMIGLAVAIWAYRRGRKKGYIMIAAFFGLAVYAYTLAPHVNKALAQRFEPQTEAADEQTAAFNRDLDFLHEKYKTQPGAYQRIVSFPLGPIILVVGLWSLAKRETKVNELKPEVNNEDPS